MSDGSVADHGSRLICHVTNVSDTMSASEAGAYGVSLCLFALILFNVEASYSNADNNGLRRHQH